MICTSHLAHLNKWCIWIWLTLEIKFATKYKSQTLWKEKKLSFSSLLCFRAKEQEIESEGGWNAMHRNKKRQGKETMKHAWKCSTASVDGIDEIFQVIVWVYVCINTKVTVLWLGFEGFFFRWLIVARERTHLLLPLFVMPLFFFLVSLSIVLFVRVFRSSDRSFDRFFDCCYLAATFSFSLTHTQFFSVSSWARVCGSCDMRRFWYYTHSSFQSADDIFSINWLCYGVVVVVVVMHTYKEWNKHQNRKWDAKLRIGKK